MHCKLDGDYFSSKVLKKVLAGISDAPIFALQLQKPERWSRG
jgi:hypothetical protein